MSDRIPMPKLQVTFDGMRGEQIDHRWIEQGGGVEAYVFDGAELADQSAWRTLASNLARARELGADALTLHFPTDHADWVNDSVEFDKLRRFCQVAEESGAKGVVLHSNQFVSVDNWLTTDLDETRNQVVEKLATLDEYLTGSPLWIGVENMPVIGSKGVDFDSVFVHPTDFEPVAEIDSPRIAVTWDLCHWAVTYSTARSVAHLERRSTLPNPLELPPLPVRHVHFSSFSGHAMPFWPTFCVEGVAPQDGTFDCSLLGRMLDTVLTAISDDVSVVLEVQENDYEDRRNSWRTLEWLRSRLAPCNHRPQIGET